MRFPFKTFMIMLAVTALIFIWILIGSASKNIARKQSNPLADQLAGPINLQVWFQSYDEDYFLGALPKNTIVSYGDLGGNMGITQRLEGVYHITIDIEFNKAARVSQMTVLHEMCHEAQWGNDGLDVHGPKFQTCMHRLAAAGAFDLLW